MIRYLLTLIYFFSTVLLLGQSVGELRIGQDMYKSSVTGIDEEIAIEMYVNTVIISSTRVKIFDMYYSVLDNSQSEVYRDYEFKQGFRIKDIPLPKVINIKTLSAENADSEAIEKVNGIYNRNNKLLYLYYAGYFFLPSIESNDLQVSHPSTLDEIAIIPVPGACYAKCLFPDEYEEVEEQVLVRPAFSRTTVVPAQFETVTERVLIREATYRLIVTPAKYRTVSERVLKKEAGNKIVIIPAKYEIVTEKVLIKEASTRIEKIPAEFRIEKERIEVKPSSTKWVKKRAERNCLSRNPDDCLVWCLIEEPAQFRTIDIHVRIGCPDGYEETGDECIKVITIPSEFADRTYQKLVAPATVDTVLIPAHYENRTYQKLISPARLDTVEVPAEYEEQSYQRLIKPASSLTTEVPAEYETISKRVLVKKGGFTEWRQVVCESNITADLTREVQVALKNKGYDPGHLSNSIDSSTKAALIKFQKDNGLPIGQLDFETLRALGIDY